MVAVVKSLYWNAGGAPGKAAGLSFIIWGPFCGEWVWWLWGKITSLISSCQAYQTSKDDALGGPIINKKTFKKRRRMMSQNYNLCFADFYNKMVCFLLFRVLLHPPEAAMPVPCWGTKVTSVVVWWVHFSELLNDTINSQKYADTLARNLFCIGWSAFLSSSKGNFNAEVYCNYFGQYSSSNFVVTVWGRPFPVSTSLSCCDVKPLSCTKSDPL